eukprot:104321-Rhodomonas_salina.2
MPCSALASLTIPGPQDTNDGTYCAAAENWIDTETFAEPPSQENLTRGGGVGVGAAGVVGGGRSVLSECGTERVGASGSEFERVSESERSRTPAPWASASALAERERGAGRRCAGAGARSSTCRQCQATCR